MRASQAVKKIVGTNVHCRWVVAMYSFAVRHHPKVLKVLLISVLDIKANTQPS